MNRLEQELDLVRSAFPDAELRSEGGVHWVRLPVYPLPDGLYKQGSEVEVAFRIPAEAGEPPYAFWVRPSLELVSGAGLTNYGFPAETPWGSDWGQFSWTVEGPWVPKTDLAAGANALKFVRSFAERLAEGS
jgi:hypothetical protein